MTAAAVETGQSSEEKARVVFLGDKQVALEDVRALADPECDCDRGLRLTKRDGQPIAELCRCAIRAWVLREAVEHAPVSVPVDETAIEVATKQAAQSIAWARRRAERLRDARASAQLALAATREQTMRDLAPLAGDLEIAEREEAAARDAFQAAAVAAQKVQDEIIALESRLIELRRLQKLAADEKGTAAEAAVRSSNRARVVRAQADEIRAAGLRREHPHAKLIEKYNRRLAEHFSRHPEAAG